MVLERFLRKMGSQKPSKIVQKSVPKVISFPIEFLYRFFVDLGSILEPFWAPRWTNNRTKGSLKHLQKMKEKRARKKHQKDRKKPVLANEREARFCFCFSLCFLLPLWSSLCSLLCIYVRFDRFARCARFARARAPLEKERDRHVNTTSYIEKTKK